MVSPDAIATRDLIIWRIRNVLLKWVLKKLRRDIGLFNRGLGLNQPADSTRAAAATSSEVISNATLTVIS